jgi:hypothetical protein
MSNENYTRGNQTGYRLDLSDEDPQTIGDLYNPGHPDSGNEPRDPRGQVRFDSSQDISQASKVKLGSYLSSATGGRVGNTRPNSFQIPAGSSQTATGVDENISSRLDPSIAKDQIRANGVTLGTYIDVAKGYDPNSAEKFLKTKHSEYSGTGENPFLSPDVEIKNYTTPQARAKGQDGNSILLDIKQLI